MKIKATYRAQEGRFDPDVNPAKRVRYSLTGQHIARCWGLMAGRWNMNMSRLVLI